MVNGKLHTLNIPVLQPQFITILKYYSTHPEVISKTKLVHQPHFHKVVHGMLPTYWLLSKVNSIPV